MKRHVAGWVTMMLLGLAASTAAQTVRVDHRDPSYPPGFFDTLTPGAPVVGKAGWSWAHDGEGWVQTYTGATDVETITTPPTALDAAYAACARVDPYAEPDAARDCARLPLRPDAVPTFLVGAVYAYGYDEVRARVLGLTADIDGVQVVTLRWLGGDGGLVAFRTPPVPGGITAWHLVGRE